MSVVIASKNLLIGNGDLFVASTIGGLPSVSAYKAAYAAGTAGALPGNVGAVKGTLALQIVREILAFEIGIPNQVVDQTVIREGFVIKAQLAELNLALISQLIGGGTYASVSSGSTTVTDEVVVFPADFEGEPLGVSIAHGPILNSTTSPTATAPIVRSAAAGGGTLSVVDVDYEINYVTNTIHRIVGGNIAASATMYVTYHYAATVAETLKGGGSAALSQVAVRLIHPYKDGRVFMATSTKMNPSGNLNIGFEELAYSHPEIEFKAIADFSLAAGSDLYELYREV